MKQLYAILAFTLFVCTNGMAQDDYALFIHGFQGSDESWLGTGTPTDWKNAGIIDDYVVINYELEDLENSTTQADLISSIASAMAAKSSTGNWVIVGHSLGGIITRAGYPALQAALPQANIKAILNVGTPHQGARAAHVSLGYEPGYTNVEPVLNEFKNLVLDPIPDDVHWFLDIALSLFAPDALSQVEDAPNLLDDAKDKLEYFADASVDNNVKDIIGLNGSMIQLINSVQHAEPVHKRAVIGTEKQFIVPRSASELIGSGNEKNTLKNFEDIRDFYMSNADLYNAGQISETIIAINCILAPCSASEHFDNAKQARRKRDRWNRGYNALTGIDRTWGKMIDSYNVETIPIGGWVLVDCEDEPGGGDQQLPQDGGPIGTGEAECWEYEEINTVVYMPLKNDIIVSPDYAVWNPNENPSTQNGINFYYSDIPADGGYNHFELRRYKRAYDLPGVFEEGDIAPPMGQAANWLQNLVFSQ